MNIGIICERGAFDRRVALTPPVVRRLASAGHAVWVEKGAGDGAMYTDTEYLRAGAQIAYSPEEVIGRVELLAKIGRPSVAELSCCAPGMVVMAFYHMAVADRVLRSSSGGRGILLGGTPGVPPACVVVLGAGAAGFAAARTAVQSGARVMAFDRDPRKLRHMMEHAPAVETCLADEDADRESVAGADVVIGAILVAGMRPPHVVTRAMVERMKKGSAIIDVAIDQGGCIETSRPPPIADPTFSYKGVTPFCVPNFTADLGRSASVAVGQAMLPYVLTIAKHGVEGALEKCAELARGVYTLRGRRL